MEMHPVSSSHLSAVGYDAASQELRVEFTDGEAFIYEDVPEAVFEGLMSAASKGSYFHSHIRSSFKYHRA